MNLYICSLCEEEVDSVEEHTDKFGQLVCLECWTYGPPDPYEEMYGNPAYDLVAADRKAMR